MRLLKKCERRHYLARLCQPVDYYSFGGRSSNFSWPVGVDSDAWPGFSRISGINTTVWLYRARIGERTRRERKYTGVIPCADGEFIIARVCTSCQYNSMLFASEGSRFFLFLSPMDSFHGAIW